VELTMDKIAADSIVFGYSRQTVLHGVSLKVGQGEVLSLLGPNGSGKTSLLKILLGLLRPLSGTVAIEGQPVESMSPKELARRVAYVPQLHRIAFSYRVLDVVLMGRLAHSGLFGRATKEDGRIAEAALDRLGISHLAEAAYSEISGGERQLTLIARALTQGARTLILDEPLNGLDYGNQIGVLEQITSLAADGFTFVKTTHFPDHALWMATRVVLLHHGRIIADGKPHEVMSGRTLSSLYLADIALVPVGDGLRTCLPRTVLDKKPVPGSHAGRSLCAG
jgi:iron complex transport system ATP-binding protein